VRELDHRTISERGVRGSVLMTRAARGVLTSILARRPWFGAGRTWIVCGSGNNGGDGLVLAALLRERGLWPCVLLTSPAAQLRGDAAWALRWSRSLQVQIEESTPTRLQRVVPGDLVVDALFGTGLTRPVEGEMAAWIEAISSVPADVVAVDLPSGASADLPLGVGGLPSSSNSPGPIVRADWTVTFAALKVALLFAPVRAAAGEIDLVDIGIPADIELDTGAEARLTDPSEAAALLPRRGGATHKGDWGKLILVGGFPGTVGAIALAARAALRTGAGLVRAATPHSLAASITAFAPEAMTLPLPQGEDGQLLAQGAERILGGFGDWDALCVGPGLGRLPESERLVMKLLGGWRGPMLIDADGLNALARWGGDSWTPRAREIRAAGRPGGLVLTPHLGEFSRLSGRPIAELARNPIASAREWAQRWGVTLVCKGAPSVIAAADGEVWVNSTGNAGLATGGSGDVLSGIVLALLGQGLDGPGAARLGCYLHGLAADLVVMDVDRAQRSLLPSDVIEALPRAIAQVDSGERPPRWIWRSIPDTMRHR